jgi:putative CocE/NonD family hydrolase
MTAIPCLLVVLLATADPPVRYVKSDVMIAMRDGVKLHTVIHTPEAPAGPLPVIFSRTPYDNGGDPVGFDYFKDLAAEGYIFVRQNVRGKGRSEGTFVMLGPPREDRGPRTTDESTDAYDTIDWIVKNVPNTNGRVGMIGLSYDAWLQVMALLEPHPALKAISPQGSPADQFLGDDFHHNGAFRLNYGFEYAAMMEPLGGGKPFAFDGNDTYDWYLKLGSLRQVNERHFRGKVPTWNTFVAHPNYDAFWRNQAFASHIKNVPVPTLNVSGWWDQEDFYGQLKVYELLERHDARNQNFLVVGPWWHGAWLNGARSDWPARSFTSPGALAKMQFGSETGTYFREKIQAPWFAYHLKDKGQLDLPEALLFETGRNAWVRHSVWPPRQNVSPRELYLRAGNRLSFEPPIDDPKDQVDTYISDPADPVPYSVRPIAPIFSGDSLWPIWQGEDQRFLRSRPDVLRFETAPLTEDITIAGDLVAHLFASTSGSDSDWVVKLIDVWPDDYDGDKTLAGYELMVAGEVLRGRFRRSFETPEPTTSGKIEHYEVGLHWRDHRFLKGHKIMVQVQSTWFPVIDRNPQTYVPNIFEATEEDFQKATQRVYRSVDQPSHVVLPVLDETP